MSKLRSRFVNHLRLRAGAIVSHQELADAIWGDDPDGGPMEVRECLLHLARGLREMGYPIKKHWGRGYSYDWTEWEAGVRYRGILTRPVETTITPDESERLGRVARGLGGRLHNADPDFTGAEKATVHAVKIAAQIEDRLR